MTGPTGAELIVAERVRQRRKFSDAHDDAHGGDEALTDTAVDLIYGNHDAWGISKKWPDRIRQLSIAGALIASEIDRLKRGEE